MTPTTIQQRFRTRWRGYDRDEVDAFLRHIANEQTRLRQHVEHLDAFLSRHQDCDRTIQDLQRRIEERQQEVERTGGIRRSLEIWLQAALPELTRVQTVLREEEAAKQRQVTTVAPSTMAASIAHEVEAGPVADLAPTATSSRSFMSRTLFAYVVVPLSLTVMTPSLLHVSPIGSSSLRRSASTAQPSAVAAGALKPVETEGRTAPSNKSSDLSVNPARPEGLTVFLSARSLCWIRAVLDGEQTLERLLQPGEGVILRAQTKITLRAGDAGAVSLTINGLAAKPFGRPGEIANAQITVDNYHAFTGSLE